MFCEYNYIIQIVFYTNFYLQFIGKTSLDKKGKKSPNYDWNNLPNYDWSNIKP